MTKHELASLTPPAAVTGISLMGIPLNEWILWGTFIYTVFILIDKAPVVLTRVRQLYNYLRNA
jgi:hypothetical protein